MENQPAIPPELQTWVDVEFAIEGPNSPVEHMKIENSLQDIPGLDTLSFVADRVALRYNPEIVTIRKLREVLAQAGFKVSTEESASSDPGVDSGG